MSRPRSVYKSVFACWMYLNNTERNGEGSFLPCILNFLTVILMMAFERDFLLFTANKKKNNTIQSRKSLQKTPKYNKAYCIWAFKHKKEVAKTLGAGCIYMRKSQTFFF